MSNIDLTGGWLPLTLPQLDFWEEFSFHPDEAVSTVAHYLDIQGDVDEDALRQAIARTIHESEVLSLRFREGADGEDPQQCYDPRQMPILAQVDLRDFADPLAEALRLMDIDVHARLDLRSCKLSAQSLFRIAGDRYLWYIRAHHIIVDGYGFALIEQRCGQLYGHFRGRAAPGHPFHPLASFLAEEEAYRGSRRWAVDRAYWTDYLDRMVDLPIIDKGAEEYDAPALHAEVPLADGLGRGLQQTASALGIGWPDLLVLLGGAYMFQTLPRQPHVAGAEVLALWLPFMSRWGSVGAHMPGMLVNILPFHLSLEPQETLHAFLLRSAAVLKKQRLHGRYRIEQIANDRSVPKGSRFFFSPLINVLPFSAPLFDGCQVARHVLANGPGEGFNLTFRGEDDAGGLTLQIDVDASVTGRDAFGRHLLDLPDFLERALLPEAMNLPVAALWNGIVPATAL